MFAVTSFADIQDLERETQQGKNVADISKVALSTVLTLEYLTCTE